MRVMYQYTTLILFNTASQDSVPRSESSKRHRQKSNGVLMSVIHIQEAMKLDESKKNDDATNQWISNQMDRLRQNKLDVSRDEAKQKITAVAHNVFKHADQVSHSIKTYMQ
eukprot:591786_1